MLALLVPLEALALSMTALDARVEYSTGLADVDRLGVGSHLEEVLEDVLGHG